MKALLDAAMEAFLSHRPDERGRCAQPGCAAEPEAGACRAYRSADAVLSLWSVRRHRVTGDGEVLRLPPGATAVTDGPVEVRRASGEVERFPRGGRFIRASSSMGGHPSWCAGRPYCKVDHGLTHASCPERASDAVALLMCVDNEPPVISIADDTGHIVVRADTAGDLSRLIRELSHRAVTPD